MRSVRCLRRRAVAGVLLVLRVVPVFVDSEAGQTLSGLRVVGVVEGAGGRSVPDFAEFNSYEAWKAAAPLPRLDAVESASQSPEFGMTPEARDWNIKQGSWTGRSIRKTNMTESLPHA